MDFFETCQITKYSFGCTSETLFRIYTKLGAILVRSKAEEQEKNYDANQRRDKNNFFTENIYTLSDSADNQ